MPRFREIAPGIFVQDIEQPPIARPRAGSATRSSARSGVPSAATSSNRKRIHFSAVNDETSAGARALEESSIDDQLGELIGTALKVANTMGDASARINHTMREVRARFGEQLREAQRVVERAQRRVR
jgi:hypothetical protein